MNKVLFLLVIISIFTSCKKDDEDASSAEKTLLNQSYGSLEAQKMDIYLPSGRTEAATKAIILIHGGGWNAGDKSDFAGYITVLKQRLPDYAIFNINYRLATASNLFPTQEQDVKAAIEYIVSLSSEYKFNSEKIALLGASAGAHLALLHAYKNDQPQIKAIIDFFGPIDLLDMYNNPGNPFVPPLLQSVTGATPASNHAIYQQSSPIHFITSNNPPTLILHGAMDNLVAVSQSQSLSAALNAVGVINQLVIYPTENHGWIGTNLEDSFNKIEIFLNTHLP